MIRLPPSPPPAQVRLPLLAMGAAVFVWVTTEDNAVTSAAWIGAAIALVIVGYAAWRLLGGRTLRAWTAIGAAGVAGAAIGAIGALGAVLIMLIKNGAHGHLFPDYPFGVIAGMLTRSPSWGLAGALAGVGVALAASALQGKTKNNTENTEI